MFLMPTWGRPTFCERALQACVDAGTTAPMVVFVDPPHDEYFEIARKFTGLSWFFSMDRVGMAEAMRWFFRAYPDEAWYGFLADDNVPVTPGWDARMIQEAGRWQLVDCHDGVYLSVSGNPGDAYPLKGAQVFGGDLVRAAGWWALPGVFQAGIDDAWNEICTRGLGNRIYMKSVVVEHHNWRTGLREKDGTDTASQDHGNQDMETFRRWRHDEYDATIDRIREAMSCG